MRFLKNAAAIIAPGTIKIIHLNYKIILALVIVTLSGFTACSPTDSVSPIVTQESTPKTPTATAQHVDVIIQRKQFNQLILLHSGQTFAIIPPNEKMEWHVNYDPDLFKPLTPSEMMQSPGPSGWQFQAIATGEGQITLTSIVVCDQAQPCPLMPMRFELAFKVD